MSSQKRPFASRNLTIILAVNGVFVALLASSLYDFHRDQDRALDDQQKTIVELRDQLDQLRLHKYDQFGQQHYLVAKHELDDQIKIMEGQRRDLEERLAGQFQAQLKNQRQYLEQLLEQQRQWLRQIHEGLENTTESAQANRLELERNRTVRDRRNRYLRIMRASVRVNAKSEVGSGIVIFNGRRGTMERLETYVLTAYHVVKDNRARGDRAETPIEIDFYRNGTKSQSALARIVEVEPQQDLALLRVTSEVIAQPASLADKQALQRVCMFERVLTVGCPLGYSPMPTHGEITSTCKTFDDQAYWMINAPTIFGNSGGGVFDEKSGVLLGVLIRIAAYKNVIDVAVPHLGIVTPLNQIRDWLAKTAHAFIFQATPKLTKEATAPLETGHSKRAE